MRESVYSVAAVVVLYNPPDHVFDEISSYIGQVSKVFVVDNSVQYNESLIQRLKGFDKLFYVNNSGNLGIAAALNTGARLAMAEGFSYLLTMDQDTRLSPNFVDQLQNGLQINDLQKVGIIAPRYTNFRTDEKFQKILYTMTSGNILNLDAYNKVGPFLEELFIDHVDNEYCLRLNARGFYVIQANDLLLSHVPGTRLKVTFLGLEISFSSHSPVRLYYFCRNGFHVSNMYLDQFPSFGRTFIVLLLKELCKIPFQKNRLTRLQMAWRGFTDYKQKKFGKLDAEVISIKPQRNG